MINQMQDFMNEQVQILTGQAQKFGTDPLTGLRETLGYSVQGFESLKEPVRVAAKSGIQLPSLKRTVVGGAACPPARLPRSS